MFKRINKIANHRKRITGNTIGRIKLSIKALKYYQEYHPVHFHQEVHHEVHPVHLHPIRHSHQ